MKKLLSLCLILMLVMPFACAEVTYDRAGNEVALPENPTKVVCMNSAASQMLEDLGLLDRVVACDTYSPVYVPALAALPQFDMMAPDIEQIAVLEPDLVIVTSMSFVEGDNPYQALIDMGRVRGGGAIQRLHRGDRTGHPLRRLRLRHGNRRTGAG